MPGKVIKLNFSLGRHYQLAGDKGYFIETSQCQKDELQLLTKLTAILQI
jgi:hypothetical protein